MTIDASHLPELTRRQEEILSLIIRAYTQKPEPVSSKFLVESYDLTFSSATIRNEMAVLEDLGYISAPHTSAGRVPTENGYRYFVSRLMPESDLTTAEQSHIAQRFQALPMGTDTWMRYAATTLSRMAQTASLVTQPSAETNRFKHLELVCIQGRLVLMVLVMQGGTVHQRMLTLAEPVPQPTLSAAAAHINSLCENSSAAEMRMKAVPLPVLEREITELAAEVISGQGEMVNRIVYREGLSEVINAFPETIGAQQAVRVFEERAFLDLILGEFLAPAGDDVRVVIAGEGRRDELSQVSMVLGRYGVPGQLSGALGILGPTHLNYGRAIGTVRYVSSIMTNMIVKLFNDGEPDAPHDNLIITDSPRAEQPTPPEKSTGKPRRKKNDK